MAADRPVIISAGGSAFLDVVAGQLSGRLRDAGRLSADASRPRDVTVIVRSGAYVVHDSGFYGRMDPWARMAESPGLIAATTVWGTVLAVPEPGLVLVDVGRRDVSYDIDLPRVRYLRRAGSTRAQAGSDAADPAEVVSLNDQHLYLRIAGAVAVGDVIGFGTSHPCTLFDKWRVALLTAGPPDADDSVIGIVGIDL